MADDTLATLMRGDQPMRGQKQSSTAVLGRYLAALGEAVREQDDMLTRDALRATAAEMLLLARSSQPLFNSTQHKRIAVAATQAPTKASGG